MEFKWFGHSMFKITFNNISVVTDPFSSEVGYPIPDVNSDFVTLSHEHYDHNEVSIIKGNPKVLKGQVKEEFSGLKINSMKTFHDPDKGAKRGENYMFKFTYDSLTTVHMGDYGQSELTEEEIDFLTGINLLLIPVGGTYTIGPKTAVDFINRLEPGIVIPMHYKTEDLSFNLEKIDAFLSFWDDKVKKSENTFRIEKESIPAETEVVVMNYR